MMSVMLSEGVIVSSPPVEPTPPPAGFSLYPALFSVTCTQVASLLPDKVPCNCTELSLASYLRLFNLLRARRDMATCCRNEAGFHDLQLRRPACSAVP